MKCLTLNRGSSSIKCSIYDQNILPNPLWEAEIQWKNHFENPFLSIKTKTGIQHSEEVKEKSSAKTIEYLLCFLTRGKTAVLSSLDEIDVIGHRIVHGGNDFTNAVVVSSEVKDKIRQLAKLAPLHNLSELEGIEVLEKCFPQTQQIAIFDTAFHHTLPKAAQIYPGPYQWYEEGIKRYGFHGISFQYCSRRASEILQRDLKQVKMVICHLGSGASLCAVREGKSIDTTMGFTPLEGLMMDTRCGSIDPGIILHFLEKKKKNVEEISNELYEKSGLLGVSEISSDMREILEQSEKGNPRATLTLEIYLHCLSSCIGSMIASLNGIDTLVFTAGIGENASYIREKACEAFSFLGIELDKKKNEQPDSNDCILSSSSSKIQVLLIHTKEDLEIARECFRDTSDI